MGPACIACHRLEPSQPPSRWPICHNPANGRCLHADVDQAEVRDPRAYLVRIVTRQALNRLRALSRRREQYVGPPEPLLTSPDVAEDVEIAATIDRSSSRFPDSVRLPSR